MSVRTGLGVVCLSLMLFEGQARAADNATLTAAIAECTATVGDHAACDTTVRLFNDEVFALNNNGAWQKAVSVRNNAIFGASVVSAMNGKFGVLNGDIEDLKKKREEDRIKEESDRQKSEESIGDLEDRATQIAGDLDVLEGEFEKLSDEVNNNGTEAWLAEEVGKLVDAVAKISDELNNNGNEGFARNGRVDQLAKELDALREAQADSRTLLVGYAYEADVGEGVPGYDVIQLRQKVKDHTPPRGEAEVLFDMIDVQGMLANTSTISHPCVPVERDGVPYVVTDSSGVKVPVQACIYGASYHADIVSSEKLGTIVLTLEDVVFMQTGERLRITEYAPY